MKKITFIAIFALSVFSCKEAQKADSNISETPCGADTDAHGCIASAGYCWSEVKGECIRLWEQGVALLPVEKDTASNAIMASYAVFAEDSTRVEIFVPQEKQNEYSILEKRTLPSGQNVWNVEDDDTFNLKKDEDGLWSLSRRGVVLFREEKK